MIYAVATPKIAFSAIKSLTSHSHFLELGCLYPISFWHTHFEEEPFNFLLNWEREGKSQGKSNKSFSSATNYCWPTTFFFIQWKHKFHFWVFLHVNKWENHIEKKKSTLFTHSFVVLIFWIYDFLMFCLFNIFCS